MQEILRAFKKIYERSIMGHHSEHVGVFVDERNRIGNRIVHI